MMVRDNKLCDDKIINIKTFFMSLINSTHMICYYYIFIYHHKSFT